MKDVRSEIFPYLIVTCAIAMHISDFDYDLPADLVAQTPLEKRDASRMLVLDRGTQTWFDSSFKEFTRYLHRNDVVVVNNSRVIPARLMGSAGPSRRPFERRRASNIWRTEINR